MMGGSHVETSSICAVPLGKVWCPVGRNVYMGESATALVNDYNWSNHSVHMRSNGLERTFWGINVILC